MVQLSTALKPTRPRKGISNQTTIHERQENVAEHASSVDPFCRSPPIGSGSKVRFPCRQSDGDAFSNQMVT